MKNVQKVQGYQLGFPIRKEFHLLDCPDVVNRMAHTLYMPLKSAPNSIRKTQNNPRNYKKINQTRTKYQQIKKCLQNTIQRLQQPNITLSQAMLFKEEIFRHFLQQFITDIKQQCLQKGQILQYICQSLFNIILTVMKELAQQATVEEREHLDTAINMHETYQSTVQKLKQKLQQKTLQLDLKEKLSQNLFFTLRFKCKEIRKLYKYMEKCNKKLRQYNSIYFQEIIQANEKVLQDCKKQKSYHRKKCKNIEEFKDNLNYHQTVRKVEANQDFSDDQEQMAKVMIAFREACDNLMKKKQLKGEQLGLDLQRIIKQLLTMPKDLNEKQTESYKYINQQNHKVEAKTQTQKVIILDFNNHTDKSIQVQAQIKQYYEQQMQTTQSMQNQERLQLISKAYQICLRAKRNARNTVSYQDETVIQKGISGGEIKENTGDYLNKNIQFSKLAKRRQPEKGQVSRFQGQRNSKNQTQRLKNLMKTDSKYEQADKYGDSIKQNTQESQDNEALGKPQTIQNSKQAINIKKKIGPAKHNSINQTKLQSNNEKSTPKTQCKYNLSLTMNQQQSQVLFALPSQIQHITKSEDQQYQLTKDKIAMLLSLANHNNVSAANKTKKILIDEFSQRQQQSANIKQNSPFSRAKVDQTIRYYFNQYISKQNDSYLKDTLLFTQPLKKDLNKTIAITKVDNNSNNSSKVSRLSKQQNLSKVQNLCKILSNVYRSAFELVGKKNGLQSLIVPLFKTFDMEFGIFKKKQLYVRILNFLTQIYLHRHQCQAFESFIYFLGMNDEKLPPSIIYNYVELYLWLIKKLALNMGVPLNLENLYTSPKLMLQVSQRALKQHGFKQQFILAVLQSISESLSRNIIKNQMNEDEFYDQQFADKYRLDVFKCCDLIAHTVIKKAKQIKEQYQFIIRNFTIGQQKISNKFFTFVVQLQFNPKKLQAQKLLNLNGILQKINNVKILSHNQVIIYVLKSNLKNFDFYYYQALQKFRISEKQLTNRVHQLQNFICNVRIKENLTREASNSYEDKLDKMLVLRAVERSTSGLLQQIMGSNLTALYSYIVIIDNKGQQS